MQQIEPTGVIISGKCQVRTGKCTCIPDTKQPLTVVWQIPARKQVNTCSPCLEEMIRLKKWTIDKPLPVKAVYSGAADTSTHNGTIIKGEIMCIKVEGTLMDFRGLWSNLGDKTRLEMLKSLIWTAPDMYSFKDKALKAINTMPLD